MSLPQSQSIATAEEYLEFERAAFERHEWLDGLIYEMAGESPQHSLISANVIISLGTQLRGKPCAVFSPNMKVYARLSTDVGLKGLFAYPDCTIVCGPPMFHDKHRDVLVNPRVVIEVLSPSTELYDRSKKFSRYQQNPSLTDYILIAQAYPSIEHYTRESQETWIYAPTTEMTASAAIASIGCQLPLAEVYDRIEFPPPSDDEFVD